MGSDGRTNGRPSFYFDTHKFITNPTLESNNNGALPAWNLNLGTMPLQMRDKLIGIRSFRGKVIDSVSHATASYSVYYEFFRKMILSIYEVLRN